MKKLYWLGLLVAVLATGCRSTGTGVGLQPGAISSPSLSGTAALSITIPSSTSAPAMESPKSVKEHGSSKRPLYISPNTQSMTISINSGTPQIFNLTPSSPNCTGGSGGTTCTESMTAPAQSDVFTAAFYDGTNATGNELSTGSATETISSTTTTPVYITMSENTNTYPAGVNVGYGIAIDKSGNIWMTNSSSSGTVTKLSPTGANPGTFTVGNHPVGIAIDAPGHAWVADNGSGSVTELSPTGANLGTFPAGTFPIGIAVDASGNVWVANNRSASVTELSSSGTNLGTFSVASTSPLGIAVDASGNVWVADSGGSSVTELSSSGTILNTFQSGGSSPNGIAVDASGNVWATNQASNNVTRILEVTKGPEFFPYTGPQWP